MKQFTELVEEVKDVMEHVQLMEEVEAMNDTGFLTEDLVSIVETHRKNMWSEGMTGEEAKAALKKRREGMKNAD